MRQEKPKHRRNKKELAPLYRYLKDTEKKRKQAYDTFTEQLSAKTHMTQDVIAGQPELFLSGNHSLRVANYRSILEYSTERIRISTPRYPIQINGQRLCIEYFRKEELTIVGMIRQISFGVQEDEGAT